MRHGNAVAGECGAGHIEADNAATVAILDRDEDLDELERRIIAGAGTARAATGLIAIRH